MQHIDHFHAEHHSTRVGPDVRAGEARDAAPRALRSSACALLSLALCAGCSGQSNSVLPDDSQPSGSGGSGASGDGSGAEPGGGGSGASMLGIGGTNATVSNGGSEAMGGAPPLSSGGSGGSGSSSTSCEERSNVMLAVHVTVPVTWPASLGTTAGSGNFDLWNLYSLTADGTALTGTMAPCGSTLPPLTLSFLVGGGNSLIEFADEMWDSPTFPEFDGAVTISGWDPNSTLRAPPNPALVGLTMADENGEWPGTGANVEAIDPEGDGNPGITGIPATGAGFVAPPVSIVGPGADQVHLVTRTAYALEGTVTSCTDLSGTATLTFFDNHVVGCRTVEGDTCTAAQADFLDANRTIYQSMPGTFTAKILDEAATCADARAIP